MHAVAVPKPQGNVLVLLPLYIHALLPLLWGACAHLVGFLLTPWGQGPAHPAAAAVFRGSTVT